MPRHHPTSAAQDSGRGRHGERLERDRRARKRRITRRLQAGNHEQTPRVLLAGPVSDGREVDRQVLEWRAELGLPA